MKTLYFYITLFACIPISAALVSPILLLLLLLFGADRYYPSGLQSYTRIGAVRSRTLCTAQDHPNNCVVQSCPVNNTSTYCIIFADCSVTRDPTWPDRRNKDPDAMTAAKLFFFPINKRLCFERVYTYYIITPNPRHNNISDNFVLLLFHFPSKISNDLSYDFFL